jgi:hypothetical protein
MVIPSLRATGRYVVDFIQGNASRSPAAQDPHGAAEATATHIADAWLVRRAGPSDPKRLER